MSVGWVMQTESVENYVGANVMSVSEPLLKQSEFAWRHEKKLL